MLRVCEYVSHVWVGSRVLRVCEYVSHVWVGSRVLRVCEYVSYVGCHLYVRCRLASMWHISGDEDVSDIGYHIFVTCPLNGKSHYLSNDISRGYISWSRTDQISRVSKVWVSEPHLSTHNLVNPAFTFLAPSSKPIPHPYPHFNPHVRALQVLLAFANSNELLVCGTLYYGACFIHNLRTFDHIRTVYKNVSLCTCVR